ncbi:BTB/POZ domain-containing protein [Aspergillus foveolatus]|uniref:BTB/POZ domain-containing protein n=1 Tax=Aspergillus foveolatus TaxID=210207 RepID=UPI003CCD443D
MAPEYLDYRTLSGGTVNLTVGASETPFDVHIELLCDRSSYFDNLLENRYTELTPRELVFPNDVPQVFADFVSWAYCGRISSAGMAKNSSRSLHLFQLWTLAERFRVPELQDIAFANCKELSDFEPDKVIGSEAVQHAYSQSSPGSTIRQLAVDIWAARASDSKILRSRVNLPLQFIEDLSAVRPGTQKLFASEGGKDIPDTPFSVPPVSNQFEPTPSEDLPRRASAAQLANRKIKTLSSRRRKSDQRSRPSPQGPIAATATPVSRVIAPSTLTPPRPGQRKVRVRLPPSTDSSYTKFSMKSILDELYKIEDNGEKL